MIKENDLKIEKCYFMVDFYDKDLSVPNIETYIYIGKNIYGNQDNEKDSWYFQEPDIFFDKGTSHEQDNSLENGIIFIEQDMLEFVYDINGVISELSGII